VKLFRGGLEGHANVGGHFLNRQVRPMDLLIRAAKLSFGLSAIAPEQIWNDLRRRIRKVATIWVSIS